MQQMTSLLIMAIIRKKRKQSRKKWKGGTSRNSKGIRNCRSCSRNHWVGPWRNSKSRIRSNSRNRRKENREGAKRRKESYPSLELYLKSAWKSRRSTNSTITMSIKIKYSDSKNWKNSTSRDRNSTNYKWKRSSKRINKNSNPLTMKS